MFLSPNSVSRILLLAESLHELECFAKLPIFFHYIILQHILYHKLRKDPSKKFES